MTAQADRLTLLRIDQGSLQVALSVLDNNYEHDRSLVEAKLERLENMYLQERLKLESEEGDILDEIRALGGDE